MRFTVAVSTVRAFAVEATDEVTARELVDVALTRGTDLPFSEIGAARETTVHLFAERSGADG